MPTLIEQLHQLALNERKTLDLKNTIKEFVSQERIFDMLKTALANEFTAQIPYQQFDDAGFVELKPTSTSPFSGNNAYLFMIKVEPRKNALEVRIDFDGKNINVIMIEYSTEILTNENVIELLK